MKKTCPKCGKEWEGYHDESNSNHMCPVKKTDTPSEMGELENIIENHGTWYVGEWTSNPKDLAQSIRKYMSDRLDELYDKKDAKWISKSDVRQALGLTGGKE